MDDKAAPDLDAVKSRYRALENILSVLLARHPDGHGSAIDNALEHRAAVRGLSAELREFRALKALLAHHPAAGALDDIWPDLT